MGPPKADCKKPRQVGAMPSQRTNFRHIYKR